MEDHGGSWMRLMRQGEWAAAWRVSDTVMAARAGSRDWTLPRHLQWAWDGTPPDGRRVLLRCHHGLGDTIQYIRFAPALARRAASLTVWAQPALIPLLAAMQGIGRLLPLHDGAPEVPFDCDIEITELPHLFRVTPASVAAGRPYLHVAPRRPPGEGLAVGLVWRAGDWDPRRSVPPALLAPLAAVPGVTLHLLQRGPGLAEAPPGLGRVSGAEAVLEAAAVIAGLDLVVSVDSMPAHLAGALGVPVWTLLPAEADWRWMEGRRDTPWYGSMRLFRQHRAGDWAPVLAEVASALALVSVGRGRFGA